MTKPNPKNPYPKKTEAAAIATKASAEKNHRKFITSALYLMKHMPEPVITLRSAKAHSHLWPKQVGLTGGRQLTAQQVHEMTMRMIVGANPNRTDLQMSCQTFLKAVKSYLPPSVVINSDWSNFRSRNCSDPKCIEMADKLEEFAIDYFKSIEAELAGLYLNVGDRSGSQYLKVLERRFREAWGTGSSTVAKANLTIGEKKEEEEQPRNTSVVFNFEVVTADNGLSDKS